MTDEQKRLVEALLDTQHDMVVIIAQSAYAEATLIAAQREIRELREVVGQLPNTEDGKPIYHGCETFDEDGCNVWYLKDKHGYGIASFTHKQYSTRAALEQAMGEQS